MADETGWMPGVLRIPSSEWGYSDIAEDDMWPKAVIHHVMQGYASTMDAWARSAQSEGRSVQFRVARECNNCAAPLGVPKGQSGIVCPSPIDHIAQYISIWNPAYHAGQVINPDPWGATMIGRFGPNPNKWAVGIEGEGFSKDTNPSYDYDYLHGEGVDPRGRQRYPWPEAMVQATILIDRFVLNSTAELAAHPRKQDLVMTHNQTDTATRADDPGFEWVGKVKPRISAAVMGLPDPGAPPPVVLPPVVTTDPRLIAARTSLQSALGNVSDAIDHP